MGETILALVDCGSCSTIIGAPTIPLLQKYADKFDWSEEIQITTADGSLQKCLGSLYLSFELNDVVKDIKTFVVPSVTHSLILGVDFLESFNLTLDFTNLLYSQLPSICAINSICPYDELSISQKKELQEVSDLFLKIAPSDRIGRTHLITHHIDTGNARPFKQRQYPLSPAMQEHLNAEISEMLRQGIIRPSQSPWCSPLWLVKKPDGKYRICFDGRKLNSVTVSDAYPLPLIDSIITKIRDARFLSSIDLKQAFFQIPLAEDSRPKTAFAVHGRGLFEFCVLPFGLSCSSQTMCRLMDQVIGPSLEPYVFYYLDDIIICTPDFETHLKVLRNVFEKLRDANLTINFDKCHFCMPSLKFLGFVVDQHGLRTDPEKVSAIVNYPIPTNTTQIKRLIGLIGYYRRFLKNFSAISSPITDLLHGRKKGQPIVWTPEADEAFKQIKECLTNAPVLASPDFTKPFIINCDASDTGVGAVLCQNIDGAEHPVAYASKNLNKCQRKYSTTEKELLAVLFGVEKFRSYVEGTHFSVVSDHSSLQWLHKLSNPSGRLARWSARLSQFDFEIIHRKGSLNVVADALSRSVNEVALLDLSALSLDQWYRKMLSNVKKNPEKYPSFRTEGDVLYKHIFNKYNVTSNLSDWKIVVPVNHRKEILRQYHDDETAAHFGISKTLNRILELYYWPKVRNDVTKYVSKCKVCAACKSTNLPKAGLMGAYKNINFPFQLISADLLGPYPRSKNGNQYLLVIVDWFTKFCLVHPLSKATSRAIVKFIENQVFLIYGVPQIFLCDNGVQFRSHEFQNLMKEYNVQKIWYTAKYHPQVNATERQNRVIVTAIRSYIKENHKDWDCSIHKIAQAIRLAKHDVTGHAPAFLTFARNVPLSGDFYGQISENAHNIVSIADKSARLDDIQEFPKLFSDVRKRIHDSYVKNTQCYNLRRRSAVKFNVGDKVWKTNYVLSKATDNFAAKLAPKYISCTVQKVISPLVYNLIDDRGNDIGNWHVKDLREDKTH